MSRAAKRRHTGSAFQFQSRLEALRRSHGVARPQVRLTRRIRRA